MVLVNKWLLSRGSSDIMSLGGMVMNNYTEICNECLCLSEEQQAKVLQFILSLREGSAASGTEYPRDSTVVDEKYAAISAKQSCPYCSGHNLIKFGKRKTKQRFSCKDCKKTFVSTTGTIMEASHFDKDTWKIVIEDTLDGTVSLDKTAERAGISHGTAFNMRHKILMALEAAEKESPVLLQGVSELDETYVLECQKGKKFDKKAPGKPRKHGAKASKRGISEEQVCIMAGVQRDGGPAYAVTVNRARPSIDEITGAFDGHIGEGCVAFTDGLKGYKHLEKCVDCLVESIPVDEQKRTKTASLNNVNGFHSFIKKCYNHYRGVATKYLNRYNLLFHKTYRGGTILESTEDFLSRMGIFVTCNDIRNVGILAI